MPTWSHSRLQSYETCPRKFKFQYIDGIKPIKKSISAYMGDMVHQVLETLYKELYFGRITPVEKLLQDFEEYWKTNLTMELLIPHGRTEEDFKQLGHRCIENYYKRNYPFDRDSTLGIEEQVLLEIGNETGNIKIQGYIDRISRTSNETFEIHDYKTGGKLPSQAQVDSDRQLSLYHLALQQRWPNADSIELIWHYIAFGEELRSRRTAEQLEKVKGEVIALIRQIEADKDFEPRKSALCSYCDYQTICPLWKNQFEIESLPESEKQKVPLVQMVDRYGDLKQQKKYIEEEIDTLEKTLAETPMGESVEALFGTKWSVTLKRTEGIAIPAKGDPKRESIETILKDSGDWENLSALDTTALKKMISQKSLKADVLNVVEPLISREVKIRYFSSKLSTPEKEEILDVSP